jgi:hypothetical protein
MFWPVAFAKEESMENEPRPDDALHIWQNQPSEIPKMPLQQLEEIHRQKAIALRARTRWELFGGVFIPIVFSGFVLLVLHGPIQLVACSLAVVWTLIFNLPSLKRTWSRTAAGDVAMLSGLEFYRREIEYRLTVQQKWLTFGVPYFVAIAGLLAPAVAGILRNPKLAANMVPFLVLMAVWAVATFRVIRHKVNQLRLELEELDALERWQRS